VCNLPFVAAIDGLSRNEVREFGYYHVNKIMHAFNIHRLSQSLCLQVAPNYFRPHVPTHPRSSPVSFRRLRPSVATNLLNSSELAGIISTDAILTYLSHTNSLPLVRGTRQNKSIILLTSIFKCQGRNVCRCMVDTNVEMQR
jgi:hypothetical protein